MEKAREDIADFCRDTFYDEAGCDVFPRALKNVQEDLAVIKYRKRGAEGETAFELEENYDEYWIKVITHLGVNGAFELLSDTFKEILPCNLVLEFENLLEASKITPLYVGCVCTTALHYCITHDIEVEAFSPSSANFGVGLSKADTQLITHDKDMKGSLNLSVKSGTGYGMAYTKIITHDIQKRVTNGGKPVVATSANVATTITIN